MTSRPPPAQQLIDGKLVGAADGTTYPILNPATGLEIGQAPDGTAADVEGAIAAARRAFDETDWSTDAELRVRCLRQLHQALLDHADAFRDLTTAEVGMPGFMMGAAGFDVPVEGLKWVTDLLESYEFETDLGVAAADGHQEPAHGTPRAGRCRRGDHAVERADPDQPRQGRAGARRRLHGRAQARAGHPVGGLPSWAGWSPSTPTSRPASSTSSPRGPTRSRRS